VLGHGEPPHFLLAKDFSHPLVGLKVLLVLGVLELVLLDVGPQLLDDLAPSGLRLADNVGQVLGQLVGLGQPRTLRHFEAAEAGASKQRYKVSFSFKTSLQKSDRNV